MTAAQFARHYVRGIFSLDFHRLIRQKLRNLGQRRQMQAIFRLPPFPVPSAPLNNASVHILVSHHSWLEALWAVRSLLFHLGQPLCVVAHDDGSLKYSHATAMQRALPGLRITTRNEADALASRILAPWPECLRIRQNSLMSLKLFDPWMVTDGDVILLDSDVMCFAPPIELQRWLTGRRDCNFWNEDADTAYSVDPEEAERQFGIHLQPRINCGLGFVARASMDWPALEAFLQFERATRHLWLVEQTAYAYLSSRFGVRLLPSSYAVGTPAGMPAPASLVSKHYVGRIRHDLYREALPYLHRRFLN